MLNLKMPFQGLMVFLISLLLLLFYLGRPPIYILDEAKNAECAREMLVSGNYIVPHFNGELRTDKPPLHYFFMAAAYRIFGVSAFSARFFSAVFGALTILITFLFSAKYAGRKVAWLTALVLWSSLHFNLQMRLAVPDPYLIFCMAAALITFYRFFTSRTKYWLWLMYLAFGLGFLAKGPVAIGLPGLILLVFLIFTRKLNFRFLRSLYIPIGILIVLIVDFLWYWANYEVTHGEWTKGFFLKQNLERYTATMEGHGGFFLLPLLMVIIGLFPFGMVAIQSLVKAARNRSNHFLLFNFLAAAGVIVFFSFSKTKLPNYTVPAYPFAAVLIGQAIAKLTDGIRPRYFKWSFAIYTLIAFAIPAGVYFAFLNDVDMKGFSALWIYFMALPAGALAGWYFLSQKQYRKFVLCIAFSFIVTNLLFFCKAYPAVYSANPVSSSLNLVKDKKHLVGYKKFNPAYVFNLEQVVPRIDNISDLKKYLRENPDAVVISRKEYRQEIEATIPLKTIFEKRDTFEKPITIILKE